MPELIQTLKSFKKQKSEDRKFTASLKGIDLDVDEKDEGTQGKTFEDAVQKFMKNNPNKILQIKVTE